MIRLSFLIPIILFSIQPSTMYTQETRAINSPLGCACNKEFAEILATLYANTHPMNELPRRENGQIVFHSRELVNYLYQQKTHFNRGNTFYLNTKTLSLALSWYGMQVFDHEIGLIESPTGGLPSVSETNKYALDVQRIGAELNWIAEALAEAANGNWNYYNKEGTVERKLFRNSGLASETSGPMAYELAKTEVYEWINFLCFHKFHEGLYVSSLSWRMDWFNSNLESFGTPAKKTIILNLGVQILQKALTQFPKNKTVQFLLSNQYGSLSFYHALANQALEAEAAALNGLKLAPEQDWIYTNLALSYLLQDRWLEAKSIYSEFKDKKDINGNYWNTIFLDDLNALEKNNVNHSNIKKARDFLNTSTE